MPNKKARRKHREQQVREGYAVELVEVSEAVTCYESDEFEMIDKPPPPPVQVTASQAARLAPGCVVC